MPRDRSDRPSPTGETRIATTFVDDSLPEWERRTTPINRDIQPFPKSYRRLLAAARDHEALVLQGSVSFRRRYVDLLVAMRLRRRKDGPLVLLTDCTWEPGSKAMSAALNRIVPRLGELVPIDAFSRWAISRLNGPNVHFCVLSAPEREIFSKAWGVPVDRIAVTHFFASLTDEDMVQQVTRGDYVFAGGDPLRDHELLVSAAEELGAPVRIASRRFPAKDRGPLPPNVTAGPVPHDEFMRLLRGCAAVAVPLHDSALRSAGQQTFLNAMALRKPVVVTDALGVRDYLTDREHALIVQPGDPRTFREALSWVLDPRNSDEVDAMVDRAHRLVHESHRKAHYEARMLEIVDEQLAIRRGRRSAGGG